MKFLLVDDIQDNLTALSALLELDGVEILCARTGEEALELLLVHEVSLAVLDVHMPGMNGFELAEVMRGSPRTRSIPIMFITAAPEDESRLFRGYEAGAVDFLHKPVEPRLVRYKAKRFFDLALQQRQLAEQVVALEASNAERLRLVNELTEVVQLTETFTAILGHELRDPLSVITGDASLLSSSSADPYVGKAAGRILASSLRMGRMIDELLDLSRTRLAGGIALARRPIDLASLCHRVVSDQRVTHPHRQIEFNCEPGELGGEWDEDRLSRVLSNLLSNALQHGEPNTPVQVGVAGVESNGVMVTVQNGGVIAPELLPHLFEPFRRGADREAHSEGLGLGLFIVEQIARAHGGTVKVESSLASGTRFEVFLPRAPTRAPPPPPLQPGPKPS